MFTSVQVVFQLLEITSIIGKVLNTEKREEKRFTHSIVLLVNLPIAMMY